MPPEVMRMARGIASLAAVAVLAACASNAPPPRAPEKVLQPVGRTTAPAATQQASARTGPLRIALLAPLSGDFADAGRELVNGAAMALFETPEADAEIMAFDTKGDAEAARTALAAAVDGRADVVVGPLFGRNAGAIAPDLAAAGLAALAFSNDGAAAGPNVVVMGRAVQTETARIVRQAADDGARAIAVFGRRDAVGVAAAAQAVAEASATPGLAVRPALYDSGAAYTDIAREVQRLVSARGAAAGAPGRTAATAALEGELDAAVDPAIALAARGADQADPESGLYRDLAAFYRQMTAGGASREQATAATLQRHAVATSSGGGRVDAVLLTVGGAELSTVAPMFQLYDADTAGIRLLGLGNWVEMDPARARELHGGRFPAEAPGGDFDARYRAAYGQPPSELAAVAYDAARLALRAGGGYGAPRPTPMSAFAAVGDIAGAHGPVRMSAGGLALRPLEVLELQPTGLLPVDPPRIVEPALPAGAPVS